MSRTAVLLICLIAAVSLVFRPASASTPPSIESNEGPHPQRTTVLDNGVRVTLTPYDTDGRATVRFVIEAGTAYESQSEAGLADVTARWLRLQSTSDAPGEMAVDVTVTSDAMVFSSDVAASAAPVAIRRMRQLVNTSLDDISERSALDSARTHAAQVLTHSPSPQADARQQLRRTMYQDETYGRPLPSQAQIRGFTGADVASFIRRHVAPDRASLYVTGSFRPSDAIESARKHLGTWKGTASGLPLQVTTGPGGDVTVIDRPNRSQVAVAIGTPTVAPGHTDYAALQVATTLIGGGHTSRLAQSTSLASTSSPYSLLVPHRETTYWTAVVATRPTQTRPAVQTVRAILEELRNTAPDSSSVYRAQTVLVDRFLMQSSTRDGLADQMMFLNRHGLDESYFLKYQARIRSVRPQDVQRVVRQYLAPSDLSIVLTGPARLIQPQIAPVRRQMP
ncbi:M16 family metallopeptidase [Longibacter salinarum]|nr:pitrilysin family protein [Longibacter salinarum]